MTSPSSNNSPRSVTKEDLEAILDSLVEGIVTLDDEGSRAQPGWLGTGRPELYWPLVVHNREREGRR